MIKFNSIIKSQTYIELDGDNGSKMLMPTSQTIFVDDNSNAISVKTTGSRKTIGYMVSGGTPTNEKWKAIYQDGSVISAECDDTGEIVYREINKTNLVSVEIGDCVTKLGNSAFNGCTGLTSVNIPNSVTSIGSQGFYWCTSLTSITIGSGLTNIGNGAFNDCTGLTNITIPDSVTSIGCMAFEDCSGLTSITIGSGLTSIDYSAFKNCKNLTSVTLPNSITSIGNFAFGDCRSLTSVTVEATTPPTLGNDIFRNTNNCPIFVPSQSVEVYKSASGWSRYADRIQPIS